MRYLSELVSEERKIIKKSESFVLPYEVCRAVKKSYKVNLLALGDVGGTVLMGLRLMGGGDPGIISEIGIYDLNDKLMRRYEREINQIAFPDRRKLPHAKMLTEDQLFDCDMFVFCASRGVPPVGAGGDVRMAQLQANKELVSVYGKMAVEAGFKGLFAVVSDPVDPLCKAAFSCGLKEAQVQGFGLGVMNGRAAYFAEMDDRFIQYLKEGRAFGPHGEDLVIADSIRTYDDELSCQLTELTVRSNMETRADGFKPYIAPAISSGALSLLETLHGRWNYSSVYYGKGTSGAFMGCLNRRAAEGIEVENMPLEEELFARIEKAYRNLEKL